MKLPWVKKLSLLQGILLSLVATFPAAAQIKPDATLPHNSLVTPKLGNILQIDGGTRAGSNLFHSFTQFNVPTGGTGFFNNALDVSNIFSRVTGGSASSIDGILKANGTASLFLLNPNGIIFGKNAQLNIGGSFVATTANAIGFGTLGIFSASTPNNPAVLTVNPDSFLFNQIAAQSITSQANLQVSNGNSLLLLGGNVSLDGSNGGQILAPGGRVELGGLAGTDTVGLNVNGTNLSLTFPLGVPRADVSLNNGTQVNVRAGGGGSIAVNANNFNMLGGSKLRVGIAANSGSASSQGGDIDVDATGAITIDNGSFISNAVLGTGNAGNVTIRASDFINIDGTGGGFNSAVASQVDPTVVGSGGNIDITSKSLSLTNGGTISASTFGQGNAGNVTIRASDFINIDGTGGGFNSAVASTVEQGGVGSGGNIDITSKSLSLTNGGTISASTFGQGNAGNVTIRASDFINIDGTGGGFNIAVGSTVEQGGVGSGGNIDITSKSLSLTNGGTISASTFGQGNAGNVTIRASDFINIDGTGGGFNSAVASTVEQGGVGSGGNIDITSKSLSLTNGGTISASTFGQGNAGNVTIRASDFIKIDGTGGGFNSNVASQVHPTAVGSGGNIDITSKSLSLTNGGTISASTFGQGNAGNVTINASDFINIDGTGGGFNSGLLSQVDPTAVGSGGNIDITSKSLSLTNGGDIAVSSFGSGNAGKLNIFQADAINLDGGAFIRATTTLGEGGNITLQANSLQLRHNSSISTNATTPNNNSTGNGGNININANTITALENSPITANADKKHGGNIQIATQGLFNSPDSPITASSGNPQLNGVVQVTTLGFSASNSLAQFKGNQIDIKQTLAQNCLTSRNQQRGKFTVTGFDHLPSTPFTDFDLWYALPMQAANATSQDKPTNLVPVTTTSKPWKIGDPIVEASGIVRTADGKVLLSATPQNTPESANTLVCHTE